MMAAEPTTGRRPRAMAEPEFSPTEHRFATSRYFDDLGVGERFYIPSRTMTEALFAAFQLASGDNHPIHYDRVYCGAWPPRPPRPRAPRHRAGRRRRWALPSRDR